MPRGSRFCALSSLVMRFVFCALPPELHRYALPRLSRIYTIASADASGGWLEILRHFVSSIAASPEEAVEVRVLRFNASSPSRIASINGDVDLDMFNQSFAYWSVKALAETMDRPRWLSWHISMLYKAESWARVARSPKNAGLFVIGADADHTFFPGWRRTIEDCLGRHEMCFEANLKTTGTKAEFEHPAVTFLDSTPNATFWEYGWVNTGLFAMRCSKVAFEFWAEVAYMMRWALWDHGAANDQTMANTVLRRPSSANLNWGLLDPYAINQVSPWTLSKMWPPDFEPSDRAQRMLDEMVLHHAAYLGPFCYSEDEPASNCKLRLMKMVNASWYARRAVTEATQGEPLGPETEPEATSSSFAPVLSYPGREYNGSASDFDDLAASFDGALGGALSIAFTARWDTLKWWGRVLDFRSQEGLDHIVVANDGDDGSLCFAVQQGSIDRRISVPSAVTVGESHQYLCTVDEQGRMAVHCDGILLAENLHGHPPLAMPRRHLFLGGLEGSDRSFAGSIAELRIWNTAVRWSDVHDGRHRSASRVARSFSWCRPAASGHVSCDE